MFIRVAPNSDVQETYSACVVAGDFLFTSHQGGAHHSHDVEVQLEASFANLERALKDAGATLDDVVQINMLTELPRSNRRRRLQVKCLNLPGPEALVLQERARMPRTPPKRGSGPPHRSRHGPRIWGLVIISGIWRRRLRAYVNFVSQLFLTVAPVSSRTFP